MRPARPRCRRTSASSSRQACSATSPPANGAPLLAVLDPASLGQPLPARARPSGVATVTLLEPNRLGYLTFPVPLFNLEPAQGEPATVRVRRQRGPRDPRHRAADRRRLWRDRRRSTTRPRPHRSSARRSPSGAPRPASHDQSRGWACLREEAENNTGKPCQPPTDPHRNTPAHAPDLMHRPAADRNGRGLLDRTRPSKPDAPIGGPLGEPHRSARTLSQPAVRTRDRSRTHRSAGTQQRNDCTAASTPAGLNVKVTVPQAGTLHAGRPGRGRCQGRDRDAARRRDAEPGRRQRAAGLLGAADRLSRPGQRTRSARARRRSAAALLERSPPTVPRRRRLGSVQIKTPLLSETPDRERVSRRTGAERRSRPQPVRQPDRALHHRRKRNARPARQARRPRHPRPRTRARSPPASPTPRRSPSNNSRSTCRAVHAGRSPPPPAASPTRPKHYSRPGRSPKTNKHPTRRAHTPNTPAKNSRSPRAQAADPAPQARSRSRRPSKPARPALRPARSRPSACSSTIPTATSPSPV